MGNKLGRRRQVVDEKYTRPQGLYPIKDVDNKKLRKLILEAKLAPCYPGDEESDCGLLEDCPICFLYYPTLNRSRCCMKSICTECFLQLKNSNSTHPAQCPFCKTSNYAVEYRGVKSKEERGREQIEEQKVIEAKIRMRQQELQVEEERMHKTQEMSSSGGVTLTQDIECSRSTVIEREAAVSSQDSNATAFFSSFQNTQQNRDDVLDMDIEEIMVMEAIWLSIQENGRQRDASCGDVAPEQYSSPSPTLLAGRSSSSPSGGLASTIAALAERQQASAEQSGNSGGNTSSSNTLPTTARGSRRMERNYALEGSLNDFDMESVTMMSYNGDWNYHGSEVAEAGTSYASSTESDDGGLLPLPPPPAPPLSPESVYASGMSDASSNELDDDHRFMYLTPPPPPPDLLHEWPWYFENTSSATLC